MIRPNYYKCGDLEKAQTCLIDGKSDKLGVSKRELMKSELPEWKKYLIANLMDLIREEPKP